jgi:hypothetical protein
MDNDHHEQEHFSLMGEILDPDIPPDEQIAALLQHANKEFSLAHSNIQMGFDLAAGNLARARIWNDLGTAWLFTVNRVITRWSMEDDGTGPLPEDAADLEILKRSLLPQWPRPTPERKVKK